MIGLGVDMKSLKLLLLPLVLSSAACQSSFESQVSDVSSSSSQEDIDNGSQGGVPESLQPQIQALATNDGAIITVTGDIVRLVDFYYEKELSPRMSTAKAPFSFFLPFDGLAEGKHEVRVVAGIELLNQISTITRYVEVVVPPRPVTPVPTPTPMPTPMPTPTPVPPAPAKELVFGFTLINPWGANISKTVETFNYLSSLGFKPTARIVFDEGVPAREYVKSTTEIGKTAFIMGELLDSFYVKGYTLQAYKDRTVEYLNTLGSKVDIWEIGNEINGEWLGDTPTVVSKMTASYDIIKTAGKKTALTLYYNQGCYEKKANEMFTWAQANIPDRMKAGLDYVLVSYYEDDCENLQPDWGPVFQKLGDMFPNSKIGFGETGTIYKARKATYINRYYRDIKVNHPRFIMGNFWWYTDAQDNGSAGDFVPKSGPLVDVLVEALKTRK